MRRMSQAEAQVFKDPAMHQLRKDSASLLLSSSATKSLHAICSATVNVNALQSTEQQ